MKKLLFAAAMLSTGFLSCQKETPTFKENSSENDKQSLFADYPRSKNYLILNCSLGSNDSPSFIYPLRNDDMALIWDINIPVNASKLTWTIEYLDHRFVKFWAQNIGFLERQRVLDIDWRHPKKDGSVNAVMWTINDHPNQAWDLIGEKDTNEGVIRFFKGVIVNKKTGQMLELADDYIENGVRYRYAVARRLYKGSDEEKYYKKHGNLTDYCFDTNKTTIWIMDKYW